MDVPYRHPLPLQLFSSTYYPYSEHPKHKIELGSCGTNGPGISAGQAGCSGPFQAPRMAPPTLHTAGRCGLGTGRGPRPWPGVGFLPPGTVIPCSGQQTKSYETAENPRNVFSLMRLSTGEHPGQELEREAQVTDVIFLSLFTISPTCLFYWPIYPLCFWRSLRKAQVPKSC